MKVRGSKLGGIEHRHPVMPLLADATHWTDAACRKVDPDLHHSVDARDILDAKKVCFTCPIMGACLRYALDANERHGVWGGLDEHQRKAMLDRKGGKDAKPSRLNRTHCVRGHEFTPENTYLSPKGHRECPCGTGCGGGGSTTRPTRGPRHDPHL